MPYITIHNRAADVEILFFFLRPYLPTTDEILMSISAQKKTINFWL